MTDKYLSSSEFHLFFDDLADVSFLATETSEPQSRARTPEPLVLPQGPARLYLGDASGHLPTLQFLPSAHADGSPLEGPCFESITGRGVHPRLLLLTEPTRPAFVNGHRAPRMTLLRPGDRLRFDDTATFQVTVYHRPRLGPVPVELQGAPCPICSTPLASGDRSFICPCGAAFHAAEDESVEGALACAHMATECPRCQQPIRLEPGYDTTAATLHD